MSAPKKRPGESGRRGRCPGHRAGHNPTDKHKWRHTTTYSVCVYCGAIRPLPEPAP